MDAARDAKIGPTAHYTAFVWSTLGLPHAEAFVTPTGRLLFWGFRAAAEWVAVVAPGVPSMAQYLELRHRCIEIALSDVVPDRVVELGAGLSRRGLTLAADRGIRTIEVDLPHMVALKRAQLEQRASLAARERARELFRQEAQDVLSPHFAGWLGDVLAGAARPLVIAEGLLGYFPMQERLGLARSVATALRAAGGGGFLADLRAREGGARVQLAATVLRAGIRLVTRGRGAREDFADVEAVRSFFRQAGFDGAEPVSLERAVPHLAGVRSPARVWHARVAG